MDNIKKSLEDWLNELNSFSYKDYESLPDMNLYMEQVIGYLERQLQVFQTTSLDKQITPSMINNYVKSKVLPSPIGKKYSREHLAKIEEICTLKQVLSIQEVKQIEDQRYKGNDNRGEKFNSFNEKYNEKISTAVMESFKRLNDIDDSDGMHDLALDFALTANAYITIAKRILFLERVKQALDEAKSSDSEEKSE